MIARYTRAMNKHTLLIAVLFCVASFGAQAGVAVQCGKASWYDHAGKRTASGALADPRGFTAAHRSLPFGTKIKVTNRRNGRSVIVRVNDRGPFIRGRVVDLSKAAAAQIGIVARGIGDVRISAPSDTGKSCS